MLEDAAQKPKEGKQGASKSKGKKTVQATEGAGSSWGNPTRSQIHQPHNWPSPYRTSARHKQGSRQRPHPGPPDETAQPAARNPNEDEPPAPTKYVRAYQAAGKKWLDTVVKDGEAAYTRLFNELLKLGDPYIDNFDQADREQDSSVSGTKQAGS